jgi:G3E family GTPase
MKSATPTYIMIGGFLGAGKTTTVARLARHYMSTGKKVGIVTNDQTDDLVDTHSLRAQGFDVGEVAGSCFCCNFDALTSTVEGLGEGELPDVILAEPVGSCTDLVATVIRPLTKVYGKPLDVAPYGVILKPSHGLRILRNEAKGGFSPQAAYIFRKQLEEADFILINRIDQLSADEVDELTRLLAADFLERPVLKVSALTGDGFDELVAFLDQRGEFGQRRMEVDYDIYAEGEAELGWLNSQVSISADSDFDVDALLLDIIGRLHESFESTGVESAHSKAIGMGDGFYAVANLVSNATGPEMSLASNASARNADVVVNARVATSPEELESAVKTVLAAATNRINAKFEIRSLQSFRPGRPVPTHRLNDVI